MIGFVQPLLAVGSYRRMRVGSLQLNSLIIESVMGLLLGEFARQPASIEGILGRM